MKAPFEKFAVSEQYCYGDYLVVVHPRPATMGSAAQIEAQRAFIETAIRNELARTANTQEGKP